MDRLRGRRTRVYRFLRDVNGSAHLHINAAVRMRHILCVCCFCRFESVHVDRLTGQGTSVYRLLRDVTGTARLRIHASSVLRRVQPQWVVFASAAQNDEGWFDMRSVTSIEADWLQAAAPHMYTRR